jgi:hypothetical protein
MARAPFTTNGAARNRQGPASLIASDVHHSLQTDADNHHSIDEQRNQLPAGRPRQRDSDDQSDSVNHATQGCA